jgi:hypothetical protein
MSQYVFKYKIRRHYFFKQYVFLLSVVEGCAYWSAHEYHGDKRAPLGVLSDLYWREHQDQVDGLMKQAQENEDKEFTETTIEDQTAGVLDKLTPEQRAKIAGLNNTENP